MRWFLLLFLFGCGVTAQSPSQTIKEDVDLEQLLSKVNGNITKSLEVQEKADKEQKQIVSKAVKTIKELKEELNETKAKLDSVSTDSIMPFKLLPVAH
jgi:septal ring factor EnvC (AmiA/AmiB activator)